MGVWLIPTGGWNGSCDCSGEGRLLECFDDPSEGFENVEFGGALGIFGELLYVEADGEKDGAIGLNLRFSCVLFSNVTSFRGSANLNGGLLFNAGRSSLSLSSFI